jgi:hypothetical protein
MAKKKTGGRKSAPAKRTAKAKGGKAKKRS